MQLTAQSLPRHPYELFLDRLFRGSSGMPAVTLCSASTLHFTRRPHRHRRTGSWDTSSYYATITHDMSTAGGSAPSCEPNIRALWPLVWDAAKSPAGRALLTTQFSTCDPIETPDDVLALALWIRSSFDVMSMGTIVWVAYGLLAHVITLHRFLASRA